MDVAASIAPIHFDRRKYGRPLQVDASELRLLHDFIVAPRPHRLHFHEIVLLSGGTGVVDIDDQRIPIRPGRIYFAAPGDVRCWRLDAVLAGHVICFEADFLDEFFAAAGFLDTFAFFAPGGACRHLDLDTDAAQRVNELVQALEREVRELRADCEHMLRALLYALLVELARAGHAGAPVARQLALHQRFRALLEQDFRSVHRVADYAARLRVRPGQLNAALQRAVNRSAIELVHERLHLEARRLLLHTDARVTAIAARLGFADASYFNRFFRRLAGVTPQAFRTSHGKCSEIEQA